jgi:CAAX prenyl protease-like protein
VIRSPSFPYVAPFVVLVGLLLLPRALRLPDLAEQAVLVAAMALVLAWIAAPVLDFRVRHVAMTVLLGVLVFAIWIAPDLLWPGYRRHWLFENPLLGTVHGSLSAAAHGRPLVLALRGLRAAAIVPMVEELFWRAWLMRWLIAPDFRRLALGAYAPHSFWMVALLFASEHGSYWDVGLAAGIVYNWWMVRTRSLGDLILAHAVTNACLSVYVVAAGKWEYW